MRGLDTRRRRRSAVLTTALGLACVGTLGSRSAPLARAATACDLARVTWPTAGTTVAGQVAIYGSAAVDRFQFYKLEYAAAAAPERWSATTNVVRTPARHTRLDRWTTSAIPDGAYRLKLTVVDVDAQERCRVIVDGLVVANSGVRAHEAAAAVDAAAVPQRLSPWPTAASQRAAPQAAAPAAATPPDTALAFAASTATVAGQTVAAPTVVARDATETVGPTLSRRFALPFAIGFAVVAALMWTFGRRAFGGARDDAAPEAAPWTG